MVDFSGVWVPLVTPFRDDRLDLPALQGFVAHLAAQGVAGFVACGSTGEAAMLDEAEQEAVLAATLQAAAGLPVLMGLSGVRPQAVAQRAVALARAHALAGFLLPPPSYVKPSQAGLQHFFETVADASPVPIVAYDIPARTGVRIAAVTLSALATHPRIRAVKDCSADAAAAEAVLADGRLALLGGNDDEMFDQLARGAAGVIAASSQVRTADFVRLAHSLRDGRLPEARRLWRDLLPLARALFAEPNPSVIKGVLARQGWMRSDCRAPMLQASRDSVDRAWALVDRGAGRAADELSRR